MLHGKRLALAVLTTLSLWTGDADAQRPSPNRVYTNRKGFKLPILVDDRERDRLKCIQLFVKTNPAAQWALHASIDPNEKEFIYHPSQDGEYCFTLMTVDRAGRTNPPDVAAEPPGLIVVVDREGPSVDVHPVALGAGQSCLQCEVRDANPDAAKTKLEYQAPDRSWQPLETLPEQAGCFRIPDASVLRGWVRATAADRAGNIVKQEVNLGGKPGDPPPVQSISLETGAPQLEPRPMPLPVDVKPIGNEPRSIPAPVDALPLPLASENRQELVMPAAVQQRPMNRHFLNTTQATLQYEIERLGPSGVGKVEVWITNDDGNTWQRRHEQPGHQNPIAINLPGEGSYGVSVVATNGNGFGGEPPAKGEAPVWRLEVDTTKPVANLDTVRIGSGQDAGTIVVHWSASDKNLKPEPIDIWYANRPDGPWTPMAKSLKNEGSYRWLMPRETGDTFYIRLEATDLAGNMTAVQAPQPLIIDRTRLKAHVTGIAPGRNDR